jgi:hypothetical protein
MAKECIPKTEAQRRARVRRISRQIDQHLKEQAERSVAPSTS